MPATQTQRPKFFEEQYLGAADLTAVVDYGRMQQARHVLGAHTWGIAIGLTLKETPQAGGAVSVHLLPGYAWDGYGRPIVVLSPYQIPEEKFSAIKFDPSIDTDGKGRLIPIWLCYDETATQSPRPGFEVCDVADQLSRIQETFRIEIGDQPSPADRYSGVNVAAKNITDAKTVLQAFDATAPLVYDESIPQQNFPDPQNRARWLIPIGYVRWLPVQNQAGHFVARDDSGAGGLPKDSDQIRIFRRYSGVVTEAVEAADGRIRLKNRGNGFPTVKSDELVWVEGDLRIEGDLRLFNHKLDFRDSGGSDNGAPLSINRVDGVGARLQVVIGKASAGANGFAVGPLDASDKFSAKLTVRDDGKVGIGTTTPQASLQVTDGAIMPAVGNNSSAGIQFPSDPGGGAGDEAFIRYFVQAGETTKLLIGINNDADDTIGFHQFGSERMTIWNGNVGIGTITPGFNLDVADRMRVRQGNSLSAGVWFFQNAPNADRAFVGMATDDRVGFWGNTGANWGIVMDTTSGSVGIGVGGGTFSPTLKLDIQGDFGRDNGPATLSLFGSRIGDIGGGILFLRSGGGVVTFDGNDKIGIGTSNPGSPLDVVGNVHVTGTVFADAFSANPSDRSLKKDITSLTGALQKLLQLHGVNFFWKEPEQMRNQSGPQTGLIAQEVEKVFPDWVTIAPNGYKALTIRGFEALVIEALRELHDEIQKLKVAQGGNKPEAKKSRRRSKHTPTEAET